MKRAHVFVKGRVQGVFYRAWTKKNANELNLTGWVRNLSDGRVEAVFEGEEHDIREMLERMEEGSRAANPNDVKVNWQKATNEFGSFEIRN